MYLLVDNYDSFTYNLVAQFRNLGAHVDVVKNSEFIDCSGYKGLILSPGPSSPEHAGHTLKYLKENTGKLPIFGVCLGLQSIGCSLGYTVRHAHSVQHGKKDRIQVKGESVLFRSLPESFEAVRYHSLAVDIQDTSPLVTSTSQNDREVMSIEDTENMLFGVQFHPESILSQHGAQICRNFLDFCENRIDSSDDEKKAISLSLTKLAAGIDLSVRESNTLFSLMIGEKMNSTEISAALMGLKVKGETVDEITGAIQALTASSIPFDKENHQVIDTCGTGGDGKSCMNVSTASAIVLSALGHKVVKHGNRAMSGKTGSADILEALDIPLNLDVQKKKHYFEKHGFVFLFAQVHHPALKPIGKIRKELGIPTLFNMLGPLLNPSSPDCQVIGVADSSKLDILAQAALKLSRNNIILYTSEDGYDEVSTAAPTRCIHIKDNKITQFMINPEDYFDPFPMPVVKSSQDAELMFMRAISNGDRELSRLIALNTGLALFVSGETESVKEGYQKALSCIERGQALKKLKALQGEFLPPRHEGTKNN